jgi:predicted RNase H-like nuclease (RuvC/YqgF family)
MGNKNKTVSFRVNEDSFEALREIAEERDLSLSAVFRDYVDALVAHDGQVEVVPEHRMDDLEEDDDAFPPTVELPKSFVREHERLELEADHLREQLDEHKRYITQLREQLERSDEEVVPLEELDGDAPDDLDGDDEPYQLG